MIVNLGIHKSGSAEQDYSLTMELPELPRAGDYISVARQYLDGTKGEDIGSEDFIVRRVLWNLRYTDTGHITHTKGEEPVGSLHDIWIECEMAIGFSSSPSHRKSAGDGARRFFDDL